MVIIYIFYVYMYGNIIYACMSRWRQALSTGWYCREEGSTEQIQCVLLITT